MLGSSPRNATLATILLSLGAAFALAAPSAALFVAKSHLVRKPR